LSVVNWGEIYCNTMREISQQAAEQQARAIAPLPIDIIGVGDDLTPARQAAIYKATHKMSCADCFAAARAKAKNAELVTGDPEFKALEKKIKINRLKQHRPTRLRTTHRNLSRRRGVHRNRAFSHHCR
jgi:predicted nucleic acid-binding protein